MTDEQTIKAFECCTKIEEGGRLELCFECPMFEEDVDNCTASLFRKVLDLINRQQTEIEHLRDLTKMIKAEAIKDFVHYFFDECVTFDNGVTLLVDKEDFDNLVKELTEVSK